MTSINGLGGLGKDPIQGGSDVQFGASPLISCFASPAEGGGGSATTSTTSTAYDSKDSDGDYCIRFSINNGKTNIASITESPGVFSGDAYLRIYSGGKWKLVADDGDNLNMKRFKTNAKNRVVATDYEVVKLKNQVNGAERTVKTDNNGTMRVKADPDDDNSWVTLEEWVLMQYNGDC